MSASPYESPMFAGDKLPNEQRSLRQRYLFEILVLAELLLFALTVMAHQGLRAIAAWYWWQPCVLLVFGLHLGTMLLVVPCVVLRSLYLMYKLRLLHAVANVALLAIVVGVMEAADRIDERISKEAIGWLVYYWVQYWRNI